MIRMARSRNCACVTRVLVVNDVTNVVARNEDTLFAGEKKRGEEERERERDLAR